MCYMLEKDFDSWGLYKKELHKKRKPRHFKVGDVWFCSVGVNIGREIDGKNKYFERPVLIIKKFNDEMLWGLPLTSKTKEGRYYFHLFVKEMPAAIILSQLVRLDSGRLQRKMCRLSREVVSSVTRRIKEMLN